MLPQNFDINALNNTLDLNQRRQMVGNFIYHPISAVLGEQLASKITGMLIDNEQSVNFTQLVQDQAYLDNKVQACMEIVGG